MSDYKLKFLSYPKYPEKMVKGFNILIEIIGRLDPREVIIPTKELPHTDKKCIDLLIRVASGLPSDYIRQVNIDRIRPVVAVITPQSHEPPTKKQVNKYESSKAKKKAKKLNKKTQKNATMSSIAKSTEGKDNLGSPNQAISQTTEPDAQSQPDVRYKFLFQKPKKNLKPSLVKKSNRCKKGKEIKHVHWADEDAKLEVKTPSSENERTKIKDNKESIDQKLTHLNLESELPYDKPTTVQEEKKNVSQKSFFGQSRKKFKINLIKRTGFTHHLRARQ